jgi:hypothetical protein
MAETRKLRVFLAHASEDNSIVQTINDHLKKENWIDPWIDEEDLLPGHEYDLQINEALRQADVILICLSTKSINKEGYIQKEFRRAVELAEEKPEGTIYIIPLLLDDCSAPAQFEKWHSMRYASEEDLGRILESLKIRADDVNIALDSKPRKDKRIFNQQKRPGFRSAVKMFLGIMLPVFACLVIFVAAASRKYFDGIWVGGKNEIVFTLLVFFVLLTLSFILFMDGFSKFTLFTMKGLGQITTTTMKGIKQGTTSYPSKTDKKDSWTKLFRAKWQVISSQQLDTLRATLQTFLTKENWLDPEFKERLNASLQSLFVPGWGLFRRGRKFLALILLIVTTTGYIIDAFPAGNLIHLMVIVLSGVLDIPGTGIKD